MKIETRKVMKLSGIAIAATAVASATAYLTTRLLTREALDRNEPRVFQKAGNLISGTQSGNAFQEELRKAAEKLAQKENETVEPEDIGIMFLENNNTNYGRALYYL